MRLRFSMSYAALALVTFATEVAIACFVHDDFVRPLVGDALVVVLVHATVLSLFDFPPLPTALGAFAFACAVEIGQYFDLVKLLGLERVALARVVIGTAYDPRDFIAYATGAALLIVSDRLVRRG
jgi:hypothetical protein